MKAVNFVLIMAILSIAVMSFEKKVIPTAPNTFFCYDCPFLPSVISQETTSADVIELESIMDLTPVVPMEADFDDVVDFSAEQATIDLAPVVPLIADFDDIF